MKIIRSIKAMRKQVIGWQADGHAVGFVPTMGDFHEGHLSLMRVSANECDKTVASLFVNPTQFGPNEDFERYPRDEARDAALAEEAGCDVIFAPSTRAIYPRKSLTYIHINQIADDLCGKWRPGHMDGVALVCAKLFNMVPADRAYFGQKDYQQLTMIQRMVADLFYPIEIIGLPTVREKDGLAMSSRNRYMTAEQRAQATSLIRALKKAQRAALNGHTIEEIEKSALGWLSAQPGVKPEYLKVVHPETLQPVSHLRSGARICVAAWLGKSRLIDNLPLERKAP